MKLSSFVRSWSSFIHIWVACGSRAPRHPDRTIYSKPLIVSPSSHKGLVLCATKWTQISRREFVSRLLVRLHRAPSQFHERHPRICCTKDQPVPRPCRTITRLNNPVEDLRANITDHVIDTSCVTILSTEGTLAKDPRRFLATFNFVRIRKI